MTPAQIIFEECGTPKNQDWVNIKHISVARKTLVELSKSARAPQFADDFAFILFQLNYAARRLFHAAQFSADIAWTNAMQRMDELAFDLVNP